MQGAEHAAKPRHREVGDDELGHIGQLHRHHIARDDAAAGERARRPMHPLGQRGPGDTLAAGDERWRLRALGGMAREPARERIVIAPEPALSIFAFPLGAHHG